MINVEYLRHAGDDLAVVNAARVSFDNESDWAQEDVAPGLHYYRDVLSERDAKLINFLARHKHKSPFNHCFVSFRVQAPIFVARQLVKHEYLPWNEVSRRYVTDDLEFYYPDEFRSAPEKSVKQGSGAPLVGREATLAAIRWRSAMEQAEAAYTSLLGFGVCPEQARGVLPQALMTTWIWSGSLYAFAKMCQLRLDSHAQAECREVAQPILDNLHELFPVSTEALMKHGAT